MVFVKRQCITSSVILGLTKHLKRLFSQRNSLASLILNTTFLLILVNWYISGDDPADLLQYINKDQTTGLHICSICSNFSHKSRSNVRNHIESKHFAGSFIYTCSICEKTCASHQSLLKHKSVFHKFDSA